MQIAFSDGGRTSFYLGQELEVNVSKPPYNIQPGEDVGNRLNWAVADLLAAGGGCLSIPQGTYTLGQPLLVPKNGEARLTIKGIGVYAGTILRPRSGWVANAALIDIGDGTNSVARVRVTGVHCSGRDQQGNLATAYGIRARGASIIDIDHNAFESLEHGIHLAQAVPVTSVVNINNNWLGSNNLVGLWCAGVSDLRFENNDLQEGRVGGGATSYAVYFQQAGTRNVFLGNKVNNWEGFAFYFSGTGVELHQTIGPNHIEDCGGGYYAGANAPLTIDGGVIENLKAAASVAIDFETPYCNVVGTKILGVPSAAVRMAADYCKADHLLIRNQGAARAIDIVGVTRCTASDNSVFDTRGGASPMVSAIEERLTADYNQVSNNVQQGATGTAYVKVGANSVFANNI